MRMSKSSVNMTVIGAALIVAAAVCYHGLAVNQGATAQPAKVVWIDIERVFQNLNARAEADQQLQSLAETFDEQAATRRQRIDGLNEELELLQEGTDSYREAQEKLLTQTYEYRAFVELKQRQLEQRKAEILGRIYQQIRDGARELATQRGYDYVMVNDALGDLRAENEQEMNRQISARRLLFANGSYDATDELISFMNQ